MSAPRIGFIGLGNIGLPMAQRIAAAGLAPTVYDLRREPMQAVVATGGRAAVSPAALAAASEVIGVCVRDEADLEQVLHGPDGVLTAAAPGTVVAVHSTVRRAAVVALGARAAACDVALLDAGVAGGAVGAAAGTLAVMVGGDAAAVERARPMLACFAGAIVHTGALGSGVAAKLCVQTMQYVAWAAAAEARTLGRAAGLSDDGFAAVTEAAGVLSESTRRFLGLFRRPLAERDAAPFQAQLGAFVALAEKDLDAVLALGAECAVDLPATAAARPWMARMYGYHGSGR
ncbi:MAG: NAD(P)-dependent oxidoreductase [Deltaproteobacteria bacterium]|nr:NAD(P)-dependent oxidoreductase [Deltaproteobacteria bacterium]